MEEHRFAHTKTGELVRIADPLPDWAFIPDPLPPVWQFDTSLWPLLNEATTALGTLDGIGRTLPDPNLLFHPLQSREALRSSSLEGTWADPQELLLFQKHPREPRSEDDPANTWLEVSNYSASLRRGIELLKQRPLSLVIIREMHEALLKNVRGRNKSPGQFRRSQVHIGSDRRYVPPPAHYLDVLLDNLQRYMNDSDDVHPLVRAFIVHYQFEAIHPFIDGNGRVGRALLSIMIYAQLGHHMPWLYMSAYFERYKDEYMENMFRISSEGRWTEWIEFCLRGTHEQASDAIRRCEILKGLWDNYRRHPVATKPRIVRIIEHLFSVPALTIPDVERSMEVTYPTAKGDVEALLEAGILREVPGQHPRLFVAHNLFEAAFGEPEAE